MKTARYLVGSILRWFSIALLASSCGSVYPEEPVGGKVMGRVTYQGDWHLRLDNAVVGVYAFTSVPLGQDEGILPHAFHLFEPIFEPDGIEFKLEYLDPYNYCVIAQLFDPNEPPGDPYAAGGYPNIIEAMSAPVEVFTDAPTTGIDFELIDMK